MPRGRRDAPAYFSWIDSLRRGTLDEDLRRAFTIAGYIFYASCEVMAKAQVLMLTQIPAETLEGMGAKVFSDIDNLLREVDFAGAGEAVPGGLGIVEGGEIPYRPEARKKEGELREPAEARSGDQVLPARRAARDVHAVSRSRSSRARSTS